METIRKYMESLFTSLPNTKEVVKAKEHLLEMAEDKYNSLKEEGVSDNEAVAKVIAEFGNLDELKDELGIAKEVSGTTRNEPAREIVKMEARDIIADYKKAAILRGLGVMCFICCVIPPVAWGSDISPVGLFILIGIGVMLEVVQGSIIKKWDYLSKERCILTMDTAEYVKEEKRRNNTGLILAKSIGILLCVTCVVPTIALANEIGVAGLFLFIGTGVFLIVASCSIDSIYEKLLSVNPKNTVGGTYTKGSGRIVYDNPNLAAIMDIYGRLVLCLYLSVSFLTEAWASTWIIFVIGAIVKKCIEGTKGHEE